MGNDEKAMSRRERIEQQASLRKQKISRLIGILLGIIFFASAMFFVFSLLKLNMIPEKYLMAIIVILVLLLVFVFVSQFTKTAILGKILALVFSCVLISGCWYINTTRTTIDGISTNDTVKVDHISILVLNSDTASGLSDASNYIFGRNGVLDTDLINDTITSISSELNTAISVKSYNTWTEVIDALYAGEVNAILFNESYRSTIEETYLNFSNETKVLGSKKYTSTIVIDTTEKEVSEESFIMFLSGNDSDGTLKSSGRSDVNIAAVVNPNTRTVLLVTLPRDTYTTIVQADGSALPGRDKLTHAGLGGVLSSMRTVENVLDIKFDYYLRLNFTGIINLVDALGGITVYSDYTFTTYDTTHHFVAGENYLDGLSAMYFARERYAFKDGDFQRNRNQAKVIEAIIKKASSAKILTSYAAIMDSLTGVVETSMPEDQISKLVKMQLNDMSGWNIVPCSITGVPTSADCYGRGYLSVVELDEASVANAKIKIGQVIDGVAITE